MSKYILVLGSNLADSKKILLNAIDHLEKKQVKLLFKTEVLHTAPLLEHRQPYFYNQAFLVEFTNSPDELLSICQKVEKLCGRISRIRYGPRHLDIDICWWSHGRYKSDQLTIPHPHNRSRHWVRKFIYELSKNVKNAIQDELSMVSYASMNVKAIRTSVDFISKKIKSEKISMLTCYDYTSAKLIAHCSLDAVMVGDSLGMVMQGNESTIPVTLEEIIYHTKCVRAGAVDKFIVADLPFMSYQVSIEDGMRAAGRLMKESGCDAVKLEGDHAELIKRLVDCGIPVMGHLGLTPQSVKTLGGFKLQAKTELAQEKILRAAKSLESAGCFSLVLEMIPSEVAEQISKALKIPTIGIGSGVHTDGQVLVWHDALGLNKDFNPRFVRKFANLAETIEASIEKYSDEVRSGDFPQVSESFHVK